MTKTGLTFQEFVGLCWDELVDVQDCKAGAPRLKAIVIRGESGDHHVADVHREGGTLILDLGQKITS
jgi:hypothetical protein